jgi:hypothetical protein
MRSGDAVEAEWPAAAIHGTACVDVVCAGRVVAMSKDMDIIGRGTIDSRFCNTHDKKSCRRCYGLEYQCIYVDMQKVI